VQDLEAKAEGVVGVANCGAFFVKEEVFDAVLDERGVGEGLGSISGRSNL
jgi:hypothetical protein